MQALFDVGEMTSRQWLLIADARSAERSMKVFKSFVRTLGASGMM